MAKSRETQYPQYAFSVATHLRGRYAGLTVEVLWKENHWDYRFEGTGLRFTWQRDVGEDAWYAGSLDIERARPETLGLAQRLLRRLDGKDMSKDPMAVVGVLRRMGAVEVVYDNRFWAFTPLPEVLPPEYHAYMAWAPDGDGHGNIGQVAARDEAEARALLIPEVAQALARLPRYREAERPRYVGWLSNPDAEVRPTHTSTWGGGDSAPDARPAEQKLADHGPAAESA